MRKLLGSWLGPRPHQTRPTRGVRRRPEVETLEDRVVPSITLPTPGQPGPVTLAGTNAPDQFTIRLQASSPTKIQFSDDGGKTFQTAALADVTQVIVNGFGLDTLTLDMSNGLIGNATTAGLPIQFNGGPGLDVLNVVGNPGGTVTETYTLGSNSSTDTLLVSNGTAATTVSLASSVAVVDSLTATNFIFNGNADNNLITIAGQTQGSTTALLIGGFNAQVLTLPGEPDSNQGANAGKEQSAKGGPGNSKDDGGPGKPKDDKFLGFVEDESVTTDNAFAGLTLSNKTNVTVNGLGGDDLFVVNLPTAPTGVKTLTIDGGTGTNVLVGSALPTGLTITQINIQREDTDADAIFIDFLFAERLERVPDQAGLNFWLAVLNSSAGRLGVVNGIEDSAEGHLNLLRNWYRQFLSRDLDDAGANFWLGVFSTGATDEQIQADILGSPEFLARAQSLIGSSNQTENFVQAAYSMLFNHSADAGALSFWENALQSASPTTAALSMMQSTEFQTVALNGFYATLLGRPLDNAGGNFWTSIPGESVSQIRMGIESSDEFFGRGKH